MELEIFNGAMEKQPEEQDGRNILAGDIAGQIEIQDISKNIFPQVNQGVKQETKMFCTFTNALKDICHLWDMELTEKIYMSLLYFATSNGYVIGKGYRSGTAEKLTIQRWNLNFPSMKSKYIAPNILEEMENVLEYYKAGYHIGITYQGDELYNKDYQSDCVLEGSKFNGKYKYGHRTSTYYNAETQKFRVRDSYYGNKYNDYELSQFLKLFQDGTYYPTVYIPLKDSPVLEKVYKEKIQQQIGSLTLVGDALSANRKFAGSLQDDYHNLKVKITAEIEKAKAKLK